MEAEGNLQDCKRFCWEMEVRIESEVHFASVMEEENESLLG